MWGSELGSENAARRLCVGRLDVIAIVESNRALFKDGRD